MQGGPVCETVRYIHACGIDARSYHHPQPEERYDRHTRYVDPRAKRKSILPAPYLQMTTKTRSNACGRILSVAEQRTRSSTSTDTVVVRGSPGKKSVSVCVCATPRPSTAPQISDVSNETDSH